MSEAERPRSPSRVSGGDLRDRRDTMVVAMARHIPDGALCVQGLSTPLATAALLLAKATHAPNAVILYTDGGAIAEAPSEVSLLDATRRAVDAALRLARTHHVAAGRPERWKVIARAGSGLMDRRLPDHEEQVILEVLDHEPKILGYHRLRSRRAGFHRFAEIDVFVAPETTVKDAHDIVARLEDDLCRRLPDLTSTIHVEPYVAGQREAGRRGYRQVWCPWDGKEQARGRHPHKSALGSRRGHQGRRGQIPGSRGVVSVGLDGTRADNGI
jgi:hypothetical protein